MAIAMNPENMSYDDFKEIMDGLCCRAIPPLVMPEVPPGCFTLASFPMVEMENENNHVVHFFDIIADHPGEIDYFALSTAYKNACERKDLELLPEPFGLKGKCPNDTTIQIVLLKQADGKTTILKHLSFPEKIKTPMLMKMIFGIPFKPRFMAANPKVGRKILQYCLENLGGRAFTCFDLTSQATRKAANKSNIPFEDKDGAEIDQGFDHILRKAPRTTSEMQQLRWQTKELRCKDSPIFGWPPALVTQALRHVSSDGALARKEVAWPIPLTSDYYEPSILQILEKIWDFDQSALILLGEPGCGKSPLGRSILMAQARHNQSRFNLDGQVCVRCTPELDFLRGEPGSVLMGDFLDDTSLNILDMKLVKAFLDVGLYESMGLGKMGCKQVGPEPAQGCCRQHLRRWAWTSIRFPRPRDLRKLLQIGPSCFQRLCKQGTHGRHLQESRLHPFHQDARLLPCRWHQHQPCLPHCHLPWRLPHWGRSPFVRRVQGWSEGAAPKVWGTGFQGAGVGVFVDGEQVQGKEGKQKWRADEARHPCTGLWRQTAFKGRCSWDCGKSSEQPSCCEARNLWRESGILLQESQDIQPSDLQRAWGLHRLGFGYIVTRKMEHLLLQCPPSLGRRTLSGTLGQVMRKVWVMVEISLRMRSKSLDLSSK